MLVTDNDYPRFYGFDPCSVYLVVAPKTEPLYMYFDNISSDCWSERPSAIHDTEESVAAMWPRQQPSARFAAAYARWRQQHKPPLLLDTKFSEHS